MKDCKITTERTPVARLLAGFCFSDGIWLIYDTLNKHGQVYYETQEAMFKALSQNSNVSFTGHSLGGGLAQYLTYATSQLSFGGAYGGIRVVTFNAVDA